MTSFSRFLLLCPVAVVFLSGCRSHHFTTTETISAARIDGVSTIDAVVALVRPAIATPALPASAASTIAPVSCTPPDTTRIFIHARAASATTSADTSTQLQSVVDSSAGLKRLNPGYGVRSNILCPALVYIFAAIALAFWLFLWRSLAKKL